MYLWMWNSQTILDRYVHDYMLRRSMYRTAEIFEREANIVPNDVVINTPEGFLSEWWSIFWDFFSSMILNQTANGGQAAQATGNQDAYTIPPMPEMNPQEAFDSMLDSLFSMMPMPMPAMDEQAAGVMQPSGSMWNSAINQQAMGVAQPPSSVPLNQSALGVMPPPSYLPVNQQAMGVVQPPSSVPLNQSAMGVMPPPTPSYLPINQQDMGVVQPSSSVPLNQSSAMGVMPPPSYLPINQQAMGVMQPPSPIPMNHQAMGGMQATSSVPINQQAMGVMQPPIPIPMNHQPMGVMQTPSSVPINQQTMVVMQPLSPIQLNQQAMCLMQAPSSITVNQPAMGEMQPSSSTPNPSMNQQMLAQIPHELQGEPVSILLEKTFEQECLRRSARDLATKVQQLDAVKMNPMLPSSSRSSYLPQQNAENVQQWLGREDKRPVSIERSNAVAPTSAGASQAKKGRDAGKNKRIQQIPVTGHQSNGVGIVSPGLRNKDVGLVSSGLGNQVSRSLASVSSNPHQFAPSGDKVDTSVPTSTVQKSENLISSASGSSHNPAPPMVINDSSRKDMQMPNDAQTVSGKKAEKQASTGQIVPKRQQSVMQQNSNENVKKRKKESSSSAVDGAMNGNIEKKAEKGKSTGEDIEAYFSPENDNINEMTTLLSTFQQNSSTDYTSEPQGFSFKEIGSLHSSNNKLLTCHFSSSGKLLAGAGHEKKVLLWNMENYSLNTVSGHSDIITDVRFRPNSYVFGTSSFDKTVLIWDSSKRSKPLSELTGHPEHVMSLDFHPRKTDLLCSCDSGNEIRFWNVKDSSCWHIFEACSCISLHSLSKGAMLSAMETLDILVGVDHMSDLCKKMPTIIKGAGARGRFQPRSGDLLAAAMGNVINLIDIQTKKIICKLQGHTKDIRAFCWNSTGQYVAATSEDGARIWAINSGGNPIHAFHCSDNTFESCTFHPGYFQLLVIGSNQSIQFWNPTENNRTWSYRAHEGTVAALADSPYTETIASAGHDQWLKVWKS